jgi:hypothetical protein
MTLILILDYKNVLKLFLKKGGVYIETYRGSTFERDIKELEPRIE